MRPIIEILRDYAADTPICGDAALVLEARDAEIARLTRERDAQAVEIKRMCEERDSAQACIVKLTAERDEAVRARLVAEASIAKKRRVLADMTESLREKSHALDALAWVWCDGGCNGGVYQKPGHEHLRPLTREMVDVAIRNTQRLVTWFAGHDWREAFPGVTPEGWSMTLGGRAQAEHEIVKLTAERDEARQRERDRSRTCEAIQFRLDLATTERDAAKDAWKSCVDEWRAMSVRAEKAEARVAALEAIQKIAHVQVDDEGDLWLHLDGGVRYKASFNITAKLTHTTGVIAGGVREATDALRALLAAPERSGKSEKSFPEAAPAPVPAGAHTCQIHRATDGAHDCGLSPCEEAKVHTDIGPSRRATVRRSALPAPTPVEEDTTAHEDAPCATCGGSGEVDHHWPKVWIGGPTKPCPDCRKEADRG